MKIILTGATGVLGSHIMYEILELFINTKIEGKLFLIVRNKGKIAAVDVNELLSSNYLKFCEKRNKKLHEYLEVIDTDLASIHADFSDKIKGYFIHSVTLIYLLM
jgi:thioester reductase-like protein